VSNAFSLLGRIARSLPTEIRFALRGLKSGGSTTVFAFVLLTLTMAAGTTIFSVVDAVALRPLPYGDPSRLVSVTTPSPVVGQYFPPSPQDYFAWLDGAQSFESLGMAFGTQRLMLSTEGRDTGLRTVAITANLCEVLKVRPVLGRCFQSSDARTGGPAVVLLSHELWMQRFRGDQRIIGSQLPFADGARQVIGVMPEGVSYPIRAGFSPQAYVPYEPSIADRDPNAPRRNFVDVVGRLKAGVSIEQASADANRLSGAVVVSLSDRVIGPAKRWLFLILGAIAVLLLVACANVANLLLARGTTRTQDLATREALGASRVRLALGLLLEGLVLSVSSGAVALLISAWGVFFAKANLPNGLSRVSTIAVDLRVLIVSLAASVVCGVCFSGIPAWAAAEGNLAAALNAGGRHLAGGRRRDRALNTFLVADIGFVTVLLIASALIVSSFWRVTAIDLGFNPARLMYVSYEHRLGAVKEAEVAATMASFYTDVLQRVASVPGVTAAAMTDSGIPLAGGGGHKSIKVPGFEETPLRDSPAPYFVTPDYFRVMDMQLVRGRWLLGSDGVGAPQVMVINDVMAHRYFRGVNPIGQVVIYDGPTTIVGITRARRVDGPESDLQPEVFTPLAQKRRPRPDMQRGLSALGSLFIRTQADPRRVEAAVRAAIAPVLGRDSMSIRYSDDDFRRVTEIRRINAQMMGLFAGVAVVVAAIGVYGTMLFFVGQQLRGIGIRMALGAPPASMLRSVLQGATVRVSCGVFIGWAISWAASSTLTSFMFGIQPADKGVYLAVASFLGVVGLAAALVPALRAARVDPLVVLRHE
jgi:putative ABC transport system permease protein